MYSRMSSRPVAPRDDRRDAEGREARDEVDEQVEGDRGVGARPARGEADEQVAGLRDRRTRPGSA